MKSNPLTRAFYLFFTLPPRSIAASTFVSRSTFVKWIREAILIFWFRVSERHKAVEDIWIFEAKIRVCGRPHWFICRWKLLDGQPGKEIQLFYHESLTVRTQYSFVSWCTEFSDWKFRERINWIWVIFVQIVMWYFTPGSTMTLPFRLSFW